MKGWLLAAVVITVIAVATFVAVYAASLYSPSAISGSTTLSNSTSIILFKTWGPWNYTVSINATLVNRGQSIFVVGSLTYLGPSNTTITRGTPFLSLSVYDSSGKLVWVFGPSFATFPNVPMIRGEKFTVGACIPTSTENRCISTS